MNQISILVLCDATILEDEDRNPVLTKIMDHDSSSPTSSRRPRIVLLVPAPQCDIPNDSSVNQLKLVLDALVFRIADPGDEAISLRGEPTELVIPYDGQENTQETLLCQKLRECNLEAAYFGRYYRSASLALRDLGPCAADLVWREAFEFTDVDEEVFCTDELEQSPEARARDMVKHWPFKLPNLDVTSRNLNVSHKFIRLVQLLEACQTLGDSFRGIIFGAFRFGNIIRTLTHVTS